MTWVKLDDGFFGHPKVQRAGRDGALLFLASLCYSSTYLTDGVVDKSALSVISAWAGVKKSVSSHVCNAGLWIDRDDHWEINDYLEYNPSRADVENDRRVKHEAKVRAGHAGGIASGVAQRKHNGSTSEAEGQAKPKQNEAPTRPDPTLTDLHPPTTESQVPPNDSKAGAVLELLLAAERTASGPVRNRNAWETSVTTRLTGEYGPRINQLVEDFPSAPPDVIAGAVRGETNNLRYYPKRETG